MNAPKKISEPIAKLSELVLEECRLACKENKTPEEKARLQEIWAYWHDISKAGIDETHPPKHYRPNIHE